MNWEAVIGLEIHVQLNTKSKLFSPAPNHFGDEPNVNITEICTGQPGSLPVLNEEAVRKAVQFGLAVGSSISKISTFDRKSYFYPDSPRNFQITQFEHPIIQGGSITTEVEGKTMTFEISHAHLEDDAGMLKHFSQFAGVDYNRAGVPLIEIVSKPCMHTAKEASSYAKAIKAIFQYLDASDCNMEEGSLRFDANVSVRHQGEKKLRDKVEIKNMNSFAFLELAIESEIKRQIDLYTQNKDIEPGTYRWDQERKKTILMRKKEMAADYRYFPEPDLVPVVLTEETIQKIKRELPELPQARMEKYLTIYGLSTDLSEVLILEKPLSDYFEEAYKLCKNARALANWIVVEFTGRLKEGGQTLLSLGIPPSHVAKLVNMIDEGKITGRIAKSVADDMVANPGVDPAQIVEKNPDYKPLADQSLIESIVAEVLKQNPESIADYKAGKTKAFAFLVGQVMKLTRGKADPALVNDLLHKTLDANQ
ncbi:MAG TPA: Asp-tRNA(Asn)/Glu-tRNA(Gln) amidotransferase subunit GatB [Chlamydiales bacterium]|nr:Asp-tRNA(Asn)/Glu-tRNA(Gln) amidotransferase subunit GatB [Chlamydiales bacterium]